MIDRILQLLAASAGVPVDSIVGGTLISSLDVDSLEFIEFMSSVEDAFWSIPQVRWQFIETASDVVRELEAAK